MTFDLARILESKRAMRRQLAALPIAEKLAMLDDLRVRTLAINPAAAARYARMQTTVTGGVPAAMEAVALTTRETSK